MPQGTKRRHDEEEEYPRKTLVISTVRLDVSKGDTPDGSQVKGRKRRRTDDVDEEEKGDKGGPVKARKIAAPRRHKRRALKRPKAG